MRHREHEGEDARASGWFEGYIKAMEVKEEGEKNEWEVCDLLGGLGV